jgi:hypothetical protein
MVVLGVILVVGIGLTLWWGGTRYRPWTPEPKAEPDPPDPPDAPEADSETPSLQVASIRVLRGTGIGLVGGFWAGALVTGPAIRLIMRLLAVTAGDDAQGRVTEADEVVGVISVDGSIGLIIFGGLFAGLLSGLIYAGIRYWLPAGRLGGIVFGALHLLVAGTRLDPLRPENPDFDIVGPGWLPVATFGAACLLHGMAVAAIANRYSQALPPPVRNRAGWLKAVLPLTLPVLIALPAVVVLAPAILVMTLIVLLSRIRPVVRFARSRGALVAGWVVLAIIAVALLPSTLDDLRDIVVRDAAMSKLDPP